MSEEPSAPRFISTAAVDQYMDCILRERAHEWGQLEERYGLLYIEDCTAISAEKLDAGSPASFRRTSHGVVHFGTIRYRAGAWAVTSVGIEALNFHYAIAGNTVRDIGGGDWIEHMTLNKTVCRRSISDFSRCIVYILLRPQLTFSETDHIIRDREDVR